ncbi:hypothetical protein FBZ83_11715 [Azospirillum brasilense]|uniref:N-acetyltransferase domain-containing protein n=1 Tax=Azospirillum brasilense TaxID=192 RepID=A0A560BW79_AZOBR|nr:hypothetical protein [Azospirillum brasilense]TWA76874.1 hypothetical protein FBZ83_11715 [Azospirillum brasilense]
MSAIFPARTVAPGFRLVETLPLGTSTLTPELDAARGRLCGELVARGVTPILCESWPDLQALNARHRDSWFPLLPKPASAPAFWVGAADAGGDIIATQGAVFLDCAASSFGERLADLSAFHDGTPPEGEWSFCASEAAHDARGRVAFVVAGWVRPDWRGRGLFHPMAFLARLLAWERWGVNWWCGLVDPETVPIWNGRGAGRRRLEPRPTILYEQKDAGRLPLHLLRFSRPGVVLDMEALRKTPGGA